MAGITCVRCQETKEALAEAPTGGELGKTVLASVCADCWNEWRETSARLINHYGLNLSVPDHRQQLRKVMKEFLSLAE